MTGPESTRYDPAEPQDLPAAWQIYLAASDPAGRDGARRPDPDQPGLPPRLYPHLLATSEGAFWIARSGGRPVGFAAAITRGSTWLLSELWVIPEYRGRGIGSRLFQLARKSTRGPRGMVRAGMAGDDGGGLVIGLRNGLLTRYPVFRDEGDADAAARAWGAKRSGSARQVRYDTHAAIGPRSPLLRLDREARGAERPEDHSFWLSDPGRAGYLLWMGKRPVAYFYVKETGEIGPLAAASQTGLTFALRHAVREAARVAGHIRLRVPAVNREALEPLLRAGFRLVGGGLLLGSGALGRADDLYLPGDESLY